MRSSRARHRVGNRLAPGEITMKKSPAWSYALLAASSMLAHCGGESSTLSSGAATGGGNTTTTVGTTGAGGGTTAGAGGGTGTGTGTTTGGVAGASVDAGNCPGMQPNNGAACANVGDVCDYAGVPCTCMQLFMGRDGGGRDGWICMGAPVDAADLDGSTCPVAPPANGTACTTVGDVCSYIFETCTCQMGGGGGGGMRVRWACTFAGREAGGGG